MFDPILVPLDGSEMAECVLPHISAFAGSFGSDTTLMRILEKKQTGGSEQLFDLLNWQIKKTQASVYLEKVRVRLQESGGSARAIILEGLVAEGITEYAKNRGMKLIILSSHGHNGLTQWGISSITQKIILSAPASVLIVRARQTETPGVHVYERLLVPLDGSQRAENVLPSVVQLAQYHNSTIHLVQVVKMPEMARQMPAVREDTDLSGQIVMRNSEEAGRYLEQLKSRSSLVGLKVQTHLITSENVPTALHQIVQEQNIDLVVLSAHGYSGNLQWPYGSLASNFIMYGSAPLLIVQDLPGHNDPETLVSQNSVSFEMRSFNSGKMMGNERTAR